MHNKQGFTRTGVLIWIIIFVLLAVCIYLFSLSRTTTQTSSPIDTYGMSKYIDSTYGFSFWYPSTLQVLATATDDTINFPGGVAVETLQIGSMGGTSIVVVNSPTETITDEPSDHASPISQTKYFYDNVSKQWMVAFPQGINDGSPSATTTANVSKTTMSGLVMLPSGRRFDTTIIPLSTKRFLVISDGGGSSFTYQVANTVTQIGTSVDASTQNQTPTITSISPLSGPVHTPITINLSRLEEEILISPSLSSKM
jgi:hypothetical protein